MKEGEPLSLKEKRLGLMLWFRLSRLYNQNIRQTNRHLRKWLLTPAQFDVLAQIGVHKELTQQELAEKLFVTKGNITQILTKMETLGLIRRERKWKTNHLSLTVQGMRLYKDVVPEQEQFQASRFSVLSHAEQRQLLHLLRRLQKASILKEES